MPAPRSSTLALFDKGVSSAGVANDNKLMSMEHDFTLSVFGIIVKELLQTLYNFDFASTVANVTMIVCVTRVNLNHS